MSQSQIGATALRHGHPRWAARPSGRPGGQLAPLRVVPAALRQTGSGAFAIVCMVLLAAGLVALLMMNTALAQGTFELKGLQRTSGTLTDTQEQLTQAVDDLRSPRSLADKAQALGMVPAKSMAFIRLSDGAIVGVAEPAKADQRLNVVTTPKPAPPAPVPDPAATAAPAATAPAPAPAPGPATAAPATTAPATTAP